MEVCESKDDRYIPIYMWKNITDDLHDVFIFRTDYEINTYKGFEKILKSLK